MRAYSTKNSNYVINTRKQQGGGENYNSPEIMVIDIATECGFASSDPKPKYGVGIDPYEYEEDL